MALRGILNQVMGGRRGMAGGRRTTTPGGGVGGGVGGATGAGSGRRAQDEAIGRGVRGLLSRFRR